MSSKWHVFLIVVLAGLIVSVNSSQGSNSQLQAAEAIIAAPASIPSCQYILIESTGSKGDAYEWICKDNDVKCWHAHDRSSLVLWVPSPRRLPIILKASDKSGHDATAVVLEVTGDGELKPVKPVPTPTPLVPTPKPPVIPDVKPINPILPQGRFQIAQAVHDEAAKVQSPDRASQAKQIASGLKTVASKIAAGAIDPKNTRSILTEITAENCKLPRDVRQSWKAWGGWWGQQVYGLHMAGRLTTKEDWVDVLNETVQGLEAVK